MKNSSDSIRLQTLVLVAGVLLMTVKFIAHLITGSNAILSDALESIINVAAGFFALYSLWLSRKPKDINHPYGHGKIEFISAGFEGGMIVLAAFYILFEAIHSFISPLEVKKLDVGIYLVGISGVVNFIMGYYLVQHGKKIRSEAMTADGKHLLTDTYTSMGLVAGLIVVKLTGWIWFDSVIALLMGVVILVTGYKLIRKSLAGLMDETDEEVLNELTQILNTCRKNEWIDMHNLRVLKYGADLHVDAHVTLPWYWELEKAHEEVTQIDKLVSEKFQGNIELFIHADPCIPQSCTVCMLTDCPKRKSAFVSRPEWNLGNLMTNLKHQVV